MVRMGTSYIEYRGQGFWCRDATLEIWLWALVKAFDGAPSHFAVLRGAVEHWRVAFAQGGSGCVYPGLDEQLRDDEQQTATTRLALVALSFLRSFRGGIPSIELTRDQVGGDSRWLHPYVAIDAAERLGELFVDLLEGRVVGTPRDLELLHWIDNGERDGRPDRQCEQEPPMRQDDVRRLLDVGMNHSVCIAVDLSTEYPGFVRSVSLHRGNRVRIELEVYGMDEGGAYFEATYARLEEALDALSSYVGRGVESWRDLESVGYYPPRDPSADVEIGSARLRRAIHQRAVALPADAEFILTGSRFWTALDEP